MSDFSRPEVILTHESDLDGLLSGLLLKRLARKLFDDDIPLEAWNYNGWKQRQMTEVSAWVCDLSFESRIDKPHWLVVDHHTTETKPLQARFVHDTTKSAGLLSYELCKEHGLGSPELDRLVHLNNVADLFLQDDPDFHLAVDYANIVKTYGFHPVRSLIDGVPEKLLHHPLLEVMAVKRRIEDPIGYAWSKENIVPLSKQVGYIDTIIGNSNLILNRILDEGSTPYTVLATLYRKPNGAVIASFRSKDGGALRTALLFQGGGHPNASGATMPRSVQQVADAVVHIRNVLSQSSSRHAFQPKQNDDSLNSLENAFSKIDLK